MCINPIEVQPGYWASCRFCWQCQQNRVNDYVGRALAESRTSVATYSVTLTYRDEGNGANRAVLTYRDVQLFLKRLRKAGYNVRYIVAGEYGELKARAHWHIVLFFQECAPERVYASEAREGDQIYVASSPLDPAGRIIWPHWPHGFVFFQEPDFGGLRYVLKYIQKGEKGEASQSHLSMSKKPPLGAAFFDHLAASYVERGLAPLDYSYQFFDQRDAKGRIRNFQIRGKSRELFLDAYFRHWYEAHDKPHPDSELLQEYLEKMDRDNFADDWTDEQWQRHFLADREISVNPDELFMYVDAAEYDFEGADGRFILVEMQVFGQYRGVLEKIIQPGDMGAPLRVLQCDVTDEKARSIKTTFLPKNARPQWVMRRESLTRCESAARSSSTTCGCVRCQSWRTAYRASFERVKAARLKQLRAG